jgi:GNAT superfamily N-acetyltransferase
MIGRGTEVNDDLSVLVADRQSLPEVLRLLGGQFAELEIPMPAERLARAAQGALADPSCGTFLLGMQRGRAVGLAYLSYQWTLEHGGKIAWLEELFVEPDLRSAGLGSRLLTAALEQARAVGCRAVDLEVDNGHPRAARLYRRAGFVALDRSRFYRLL